MSQAEDLIKIARGTVLFKSAGRGIARIGINGHFENHKIRSSAFRNWLRGRYYIEEGKPPSSQPLQDAVDQVEAESLYDGFETETAVRVVEKEGNLYIDLANDMWQQVKVTPDGWQIIESDEPGAATFLRNASMAALPVPKEGGSIELLRKYLNVPDSDFKLIIGWLVGAFMPAGPYPILTLQGEEGTGKSTTSRILRNLIDPSKVPTRTTPRNEQDLVIQAANSWVLAFDNLTGCKPWLSDAFCRLSTGGGFGTRKLYTDDEEQIFTATRPIILNGIDAIATRGDLLSRSIVLELPAIPMSKKLQEAKLKREFTEDYPLIFGALLDAVVCAWKRKDEIKLPALPRMADFAVWVEAAAPALEWQPGKFLNDYKRNAGHAVETVLDADTLAEALRTLLQKSNHVEGNATEIVEKLNSVSPDGSDKFLPTTRTLKNRLTRLAPSLRQIGITWEAKHTETGTKYTIDLIHQKPSVSSVSSESKGDNELAPDGKLTELTEPDNSVSELSASNPMGGNESDRTDRTDRKKQTKSLAEEAAETEEDWKFGDDVKATF